SQRRADARMHATLVRGAGVSSPTPQTRRTAVLIKDCAVCERAFGIQRAEDSTCSACGQAQRRRPEESLGAEKGSRLIYFRDIDQNVRVSMLYDELGFAHTIYQRERNGRARQAYQQRHGLDPLAIDLDDLLQEFRSPRVTLRDEAGELLRRHVLSDAQKLFEGYGIDVPGDLQRHARDSVFVGACNVLQ